MIYIWHVFPPTALYRIIYCLHMWPHLLYWRRNKIHGIAEDSKENSYPWGQIHVCCAMTLLPQTPLPRQPNKYFLELLFTFPNLVVFLTYAIMWWAGSFLFGPAGSQQPSVPTYWQALDLESIVVIVIYASSDDRCAHIVLSIRLRQLKVTVRLGFNHCLFPRKWNCHHVS